MTKAIALCGVQDEIARALERHGGYRLLRFGDDPERRGDVKLAYYLRDGPPVALTVVGYPGAEGLSACDYLRGQNRALPILWLCDRREFEPEAKRLGVNFYGNDLSGAESTIQGILKTIHIKDFKEEPHEKTNFKYGAVLLHGTEPAAGVGTGCGVQQLGRGYGRRRNVNRRHRQSHH